MSRPVPSPSLSAPRVQSATLWPACALVLAVVAVYWGSLNTPFIFDDIAAVERNATIRQLWPLGPVLLPPTDGNGVAGRPLVNLSLALNYAADGLNVRGYHALNLAFHALTVLVLWGILRRTLALQPPGRAVAPLEGPAASPDRSRADAGLLAWGVALVWAVHPLLTESVVCVVQRNEIMGSFFYLLTLYCFIRAATESRDAGPSPKDGSERRTGFHWLTASFLSCLAGVVSKEIVATAPLVVFLYDRIFISGSFPALWRRRKGYYGALVATWLPLAGLVWLNRQRGGTVGFGLGISPWEYLLTQCHALVLYLKLSVCAGPLVLDYGWPVFRRLGEVWWEALLIVGLLVGTGIALWRKPVLGFVAASFFIMLAPSSSFVPLVTQTIAEHRMYLPLAAVIAALFAGAYAVGGRTAIVVMLAAAFGLGLMTVKRISDYRSDLSIWQDTVAKYPGNARAHGNLGHALVALGRWEEALVASHRELETDPTFRGNARANIGRALTELGRPAEAVPYFAEGLQLRPDNFDLHNNYGVALAALGRFEEAFGQYEAAKRLQPEIADTYNNLANALAKTGRPAEALANYETAVRLRPGFTEAETNWARALAESGRLPEALMHFENVLQARPDSAEAHEDLAQALLSSGRRAEAIPLFEAAVQREPGRAGAQAGLASALVALDRVAEAIPHYLAAVQLKPELVEAQHNLAVAYMRLERPAEARPFFEATVRLMPASAEAHHELALVLGALQQWTEAIRQEQEALRLRPDFAEASEHLAWLRQQ